MHIKRAVLLGGPYLQDDVGVTEQLSRVVNDRCAGRAILIVEERRSGACVGFDENVET